MFNVYRVLLTVAFHVQFVVIRRISDFPIFGNLVSRKRRVVQQRGPKFGPPGFLLSECKVVLTVKISQSV